MASNKRRCPYCFSQIREENGSGDQKWFNDPILVPSGSPNAITYIPTTPEETDFIVEQITNIPVDLRAFKGFSQINYVDMYDLQQERKNQELQVGIPEEELTIFSEINNTGLFQITKQHIQELRDSTEKILKFIGRTKIEENIEVADLEQYFNYDEEGTEYNIGNHQLTWIDPNLDLWKGHINNLHLEDLRHYLPIGWIESFEQTSEPLPLVEIFTSSGGTQQKGYHAWYMFDKSWYVSLHTALSLGTWTIDNFEGEKILRNQYTASGLNRSMQFKMIPSNIEEQPLTYNPNFTFEFQSLNPIGNLDDSTTSLKRLSKFKLDSFLDLEAGPTPFNPSLNGYRFIITLSLKSKNEDIFTGVRNLYYVFNWNYDFAEENYVLSQTLTSSFSDNLQIEDNLYDRFQIGYNLNISEEDWQNNIYVSRLEIVSDYETHGPSSSFIDLDLKIRSIGIIG